MVNSRLNRLPDTVVAIYIGDGGNTKGEVKYDAVFMGVSARCFKCGGSDSYLYDVRIGGNMKEEMKGLLFAGFLLLLFVGMGLLLVLEYDKEKKAEKAHIEEIKSIGALAQMRWNNEVDLRTMPMRAKLEAMKRVDEMEREDQKVQRIKVEVER